MTDSISKIKEELAKACQDSNRIPGAVLAAVDKNGNLLVHESAGVRQIGSSEAMDKNALHWMASCTKLITAIAAMQLVEQGKVQLDEPIAKHLPEYSKLEEFTKTKATLRHLLCHTSGQSYPFFNHKTAEFFKENRIGSFDCSLASISGPLNAEPGTKWEYGTNIDWAGRLVEKVSGLSLDQYFQQNIFAPLGISRITLLPQSGIPGGIKGSLAGMNFKDASGNVKPIPHPIQQDESKIEVQYGGAGAYGNAAEYVQILAALMNGGTHPKTKKAILKPETVKELIRDQLSKELTSEMYKEIPAAQPEYTNPVTILEGLDKNWAFAGCKVPVTANFVWWAGIANHYWFLDLENGVAAMIQCQVLPFFDADITGLFFGQVMPELLKIAKEGQTVA